YPMGWHSRSEWLRVMLGQLWALPGRRAWGDMPVMTFRPRASNLTLSLLVNLALHIVNSFVHCAQNCCRQVNANKCAPLLSPAQESVKVKPSRLSILPGFWRRLRACARCLLIVICGSPALLIT